jgi:type VI protein secretion system component VasF
MMHHRDRDAHRDLSETPKPTPRRRWTDKPDYLLAACLIAAGVAMFFGFAVLVELVSHLQGILK